MESDGPVFNERQHQQVREDTEAGAGPEGVARGVTTRDEADESQAGTTGMEPPPTVSFIVVCHRCLPPCACHFRLNCLNERRLDLVARCISQSLFTSEGTRCDTEAVLCFPLEDHPNVGTMRQKLDRKKALPGQDSVGTRSGAAGAGGWRLLRVRGSDVRHLKVDERTVAVVLRHFLYAGECGAARGGPTGSGEGGGGGEGAACQHSRLLASDGYCPVGSVVGERQLEGESTPDVQGGGGGGGEWMHLPGKKCCKGFQYRWAASLAEAVPRASPTGDAGGAPSQPPPRHRTYLLAPGERGARTTRPADVERAIHCPAASSSSSSGPGGGEVRRSFVLGDDVGLMDSDLAELAPAAATPLSLGPGMMLTSQCITVLRHYIDLLASAAA
eukprot:jgi/Tetstr1/423166/TSEL_013934.t1